MLNFSSNLNRKSVIYLVKVTENCLTFPYSDFLEDVGSYALFGESASDVEEQVKKVANSVKTFYEKHKTIIFAGEALLLIGTGLGEAGVLEMAIEAYEAGGVDALLEGAADMAVETASSVKNFANGMFEAIKSVKSLPSAGTVVESGKAALDLLGPYIEKFATDTVMEKFPLVTAQLLVLFANSVIAAIVKSDKPELACKMENVLRENMKEAVNARLMKIETPTGYGDIINFINDVREIQYKPYNKHGYNTTKHLRCDKGSNPICFEDLLRKGADKKICSSSRACYGDYAAMIRHKTEDVYPISLYEKTCNNAITQDKIDGNFIILDVLSTIYH